MINRKIMMPDCLKEREIDLFFLLSPSLMESQADFLSGRRVRNIPEE